VLAQIIGRDPRGWLAAWTLDVGKNHGVKVGQIVVAESGYVGKIVSVEDTSSQVKPFLDNDAVAAYLPERKVASVVQGNGTATLDIDNLDCNRGIKAGDLVVTRGMDGKLPGGIPIGYVTHVVRHTDTSFIKATLTPAVHFEDVREVLVLEGGK
jgi:rod shape-determining protein MreC